jgi:CBS domain containing-hemolysin-like protein
LLNRGGKSNEQQQNEAIDAAIFKNAIEFKSRKVRNCMVPRTDIIAVDIRQSVEDLSRAFTTSGRTKIIIFDGNLDNVVGYCHALKLFDDPETIAQVTVPILIVPETTALQEMMYQFLTNHRSIAVVTDEFGGTAGIVTIEDVIEEILGEIVDEHDRDTEPFVKIAENHFEMSGKTKIDELIEKLNLNIPEGEYDTVGGYIMSYLGEVPAVNAVVETEDYLMTVLEMKGVRVEKVSLLIKKT